MAFSTNIINAMENKDNHFSLLLTDDFIWLKFWESDLFQAVNLLTKKMFYKHVIFPSLKIINRIVWNTKWKSSILRHSSLNLFNCSYYLIPKRVIKRKALLWWRWIQSFIKRFWILNFFDGNFSMLQKKDHHLQRVCLVWNEKW